MVFFPDFLIASTSADFGNPPAKTTNFTSFSLQISRCFTKLGAIVMRFTAKGFFIFSIHLSISFSKSSGGIFPPAKTGNAPLSLTALTRL